MFLWGLVDFMGLLWDLSGTLRHGLLSFMRHLLGRVHGSLMRI